MSETLISEQDLINSICLHHAREKHIMPEDVEVVLHFSDERGYEAEIFTFGATTFYNEGNIITSLRLWVEDYLNMDPYSTAIRLDLVEGQGIVAYVK